MINSPLVSSAILNYLKNVTTPSFQEFHAITPWISEEAYMDELERQPPRLKGTIFGLPCITIHRDGCVMNIILAHIVSVDSRLGEITMSNGVNYLLTPDEFESIEGMM